MMDIIKGLDYLHGPTVNIIHGDVKGVSYIYRLLYHLVLLTLLSSPRSTSWYHRRDGPASRTLVSRRSQTQIPRQGLRPRPGELVARSGGKLLNYYVRCPLGPQIIQL